MVDLVTPELVYGESSMPRLAIFAKIETDTHVNMWAGIGDITIPAGVSVLDPVGATYKNVGILQNLPEINQVINGEAERFEVTLSGVNDQILNLFVHGDALLIRGKKFSIGIGFLDMDWQLIGAIHWIRRGRIDQAVFGQDARFDRNAPRRRYIGVSVGTLLTNRRRPALSVWTDQAQQRRSPGDRYCERVTINTEIEKDWPRFTSDGKIQGDTSSIK